MEAGERSRALREETLERENVRVAVAGRMLAKRVMGKSSFASLQDYRAYRDGARSFRDVAAWTPARPALACATEVSSVCRGTAFCSTSGL